MAHLTDVFSSFFENLSTNANKTASGKCSGRSRNRSRPTKNTCIQVQHLKNALSGFKPSLFATPLGYCSWRVFYQTVLRQLVTAA